MSDLTEYISMWSREELAEVSRRKALSMIGVKENGTIIQPPVCRVCGGGCIEVDLGTKFLQCLECGHSEEAHYYNSVRFRGVNSERVVDV